MYWANFWQTTIPVQIGNTFVINFIEVCSPYLYASFGTFCAKIGQLFEARWVSLWVMLGNQQIAAIVGKSRQFQDSSECWKTHCAANNRPIWTQKAPKEA